MVQRKRTAGPASQRSTRSQKLPENEHDVQNTHAHAAKVDPQLEEAQSMPRKRARTRKSDGAVDPSADGDLKDELMIDSEYTDHAAGADDKPQKSDAPEAAESGESQPHLAPQTHSLDQANEAIMRDESPTTEMSRGLEGVDIKTPKKQDSMPNTPKSTRSTRPRGKAPAVDANITDEPSSIVTEEPTRRSGRVRKANPIYNEDKYLDAAEKQREIPLPKPKSKPKAPGTAAKTGVWSAHHLLTSKKSKIINAEANACSNSYPRSSSGCN
ncbi:hypothetical protein DRE_06652 [Drechslerella stenobrocha 248]|uniref:Uncharacterized protein n=1 Tax=Drechslerella stenobrocha 248 TaxID=1043628 RepID=W7HKQ8_9PEZI|nr:hypothetical protein DRE_06652 [Drechslerella stenobrocha 248]